MPSRDGSLLSTAARRRALRLGYWNGALWAIGNALTTGPLVIYLALDLGAAGMSLSLILAVPSLVGLLRLGTPSLIRALGTAKRVCLATFFASYLLICLLPFLATSPSFSSRAALWSVVGLLCVHQLLEYIGQAAQWEWMAELAPLPIRGRYFARRQMWQLALVIPMLWGSAYFADHWKATHPHAPLLGYAIPTGVGAVLLLLSVIPLVAMPATSGRRDRQFSPSLSWLPEVMANRPFLRLLLFGCWFSLANGITQSAQNIHPKAVLGLTVLHMAVLRTLMQVGQFGLSPWIGRFSDRFGNRPVLLLCQGVTAFGPLFYLLASPAQPWWIAGAWIAWSAYAGLNICTPNLILKLSERRNTAAYVACYYAASNLTHAASTVVAGYWLDVLRVSSSPWLDRLQWDAFDCQFAAGWLLRTLAMFFLLGINESGAWTWGEIWKKA